MTPIDTYRVYLAIKLHFTRDAYDVVVSRGAVKVSEVAFENSNLRPLMTHLSKRFQSVKEASTYFVAMQLYDVDLFDVEQREHAFAEWTKRKMRLTQLVLDDIPNFSKDRVEILIGCGKIHVETAGALYALYPEWFDHQWKIADPYLYKQLRLKIRKMKPARIVISPGPGRPEDAGVTVNVIKEFSGKIPILGVCLGHQAIGYAFGGKIINAKRLMHGKTSKITHDGKDVFKGLPNPFEATRYHSLVIDPKSVPSTLEVTAWSKDEDREIMGVRHKNFPLWGVQFHPESILTTSGKDILKNFLKL